MPKNLTNARMSGEHMSAGYFAKHDPQRRLSHGVPGYEGMFGRVKPVDNGATDSPHNRYRPGQQNWDGKRAKTQAPHVTDKGRFAGYQGAHAGGVTKDWMPGNGGMKMKKGM